MKNWIAMFAVCSVAPGAFAEVVSLIPGQQVVVPATQPGSVPVTIEASLLKQTSQLSFLPAYECQSLTAAQLQDLNDPANDVNLCDAGGIGLLNFLERSIQGVTSATKPTVLRRTYGYGAYNGQTFAWLFRNDFNSSWSGIKIDLNTGNPTEVSTPIEYTIKLNSTPYFYSGGVYNERNLRLVAADQKIYSDINGTNAATKSRPSVNYKQVYSPTWAFDSWQGPALPISRLASTQNIIARTQYLTGAGFKVTDLGDGLLYAVGSYKTVNMRMTAEGQKLFTSSLGATSYTAQVVRGTFNPTVPTEPTYNPMSFSANIGYFIN